MISGIFAGLPGDRGRYTETVGRAIFFSGSQPKLSSGPMAATFECPSCGMDVEGHRRDHQTCPYCGYEFPIQKMSYTVVAILLVVLMVFFALSLL